MKIIILFLIILYAFNAYAWDKYRRMDCSHKYGCFLNTDFPIPDEIEIEVYIDETLKLKLDEDEIYTFVQVYGTTEYTHNSGIFVDHKKPELANRAALFMDLNTASFGLSELCAFGRGFGSPVGYYLEPISFGTYMAEIYLLGKLYEVSVIKTENRLRITLVEKDNPANLIQIYYSDV